MICVSGDTVCVRVNSRGRDGRVHTGKSRSKASDRNVRPTRAGRYESDYQDPAYMILSISSQLRHGVISKHAGRYELSIQTGFASHCGK